MMQIAGLYSVQNAQAVLESYFPQELAEVQTIIASVDTETVLVSPPQQRVKLLNQMLHQTFFTQQWRSETLFCEYSLEHYTQEFRIQPAPEGATRKLDFVKNRLGVDILFKDVRTAVYDICAEMTIFYNRGLVEVGVGVVPIQSFGKTLSARLPSFEQFVWDLQHRGVSNIDIPVLILGVAA